VAEHKITRTVKDHISMTRRNCGLLVYCRDWSFSGPL